MSARRLLVPAFLLAASFSAGPAAAQDAAASAEITALQAEIARDAAKLSSVIDGGDSHTPVPGGCAVACPALASMERAVARICTLDAGSRCADARAKLREAARRVQQACGTCPTPDKHRGLDEDKDGVPSQKDAEEKPAPAKTPPPAAPQVAVQTAGQAQSAAPRHGGCAGCEVARDERGTPAAGLLAAVGALVHLLGRRRQRARREKTRR